MTRKDRPHILGFLRQTDGAIAVEFAIVGTLFLLLIAGITDFGHAYYMQQVITNASQTGARYGITYVSDANGVRIAPNALNPTIRNYILTNCLSSGVLPSDANPSVTVGGAGYTTGIKGAGLEVTVTATKTWFIVSSFIPGLGNHITLQAKAVMLCE
jgi:Flp pilus assembly protein TadG